MAAGIAPLGAWTAIGAANETASRTDLSGNSHTFTTTSAPGTFSATNGWTTTGSGQHYKSMVLPSTAVTIIARVTGLTLPNGSVAFGASSTSPTRYSSCYGVVNGVGFAMGSATATASGGLSSFSGTLIVSRAYGYKNTTKSAISAAGAAPAVEVALFGSNSSGTIVASPAAFTIRSFAIWPELTEEQALLQAAAMP